jgi:ADP-ribose pyrophosphatase YjhB (NUDIX family)
MPHIHELYDYTITVFIVNKKGKALLVNHPRYNKWIPMGGHIELNEDPEEALFREIKEETGLDVTILSSKPNIASEGTKFITTPNYVDVHDANPPHKHVSFTYFAIATTDDFTLSDEHDDMKWFTEEELEDATFAISNAVKFYCKEAIKLAKATTSQQ